MPRLSLVALVLLAACADGEAPEQAPAPAAGAVEVVSNETPAGDGVSNLDANPRLEVDVDTTGPARVEVAGETVPTRGVALDIESGDRACYLTVRDDGGAATTVMADYSVCDSNAILDRRVYLEYAPSNVIAASCEGDPDCLETETVAMVVVATPIDGE